MKNISKLILLSVAALFAGCAQEEFNATEGDGLRFTATIADATRTSINVDGTSGKVNWVDGDEISINGVTYVAAPDADDPSKAVLTKKNDSDADPEQIDGKYYATYSCTYDASAVTGELPDTQTFDGSNISAPMYAESATTSLSFSNICGLIGFNLTGKTADATVKSITLTANENLCGNFELVDGVASLTSGSKTVTIDCGSGVALSTSEASSFYAAIPEGTYSDIKFTVKFTDDNTLTFSRKSDLTVAANSLIGIDLNVGVVARFTNNGGTTWKSATSLAKAISGIEPGIEKDNCIVELLADDAIGANALPDLSTKQFTLKGNGHTYDISARTGEFASSTSTDVTVENLVIDGKKTSNAKRLLANKGNVTFEGGEIKDILFKVSGNAYGIIVNAGGSAYKDATLTFNGTYIHDCESNGANSYGFIDNDPGHVVMNGCTVENIKAVGTSTIIRGGFIYNTQTGNIGGTLNATDCSFSGCSSTLEGGCISNYAGDVVLDNVTITGCSSKNGGAINSGVSGTGSRSVTMNNCTVVDNSSNTFYLNGGQWSLTDTKVANTKSDGYVFYNNTSTTGSLLTINSGYYAAEGSISTSATAYFGMTINGGYFSNKKMSGYTKFADGKALHPISAVNESISDTDYSFPYQVKSVEGFLAGHNVLTYMPFDGNVDVPVGMASSTAKNTLAYSSSGAPVTGETYLDLANGYLTLSGLKFGKESFTIAFWMKDNLKSSDPPIICNKDYNKGTNDGMALTVCSTGSIFRFNIGDGSNSTGTNYQFNTTKDQWMHIAVVVDRVNNKISMYRNFERLVYKDITSTFMSVDCDGPYDITIGQNGTGKYGTKLKAYIDDLIITRDAYLESDIASLKTHYGM